MVKKSKNFRLFVPLSLVLFFSFCVFILPNNAFASPAITSFTLNGNSQNVTFNPNNGELVSIEVKANIPVKFTRLYICSTSQICNGTSGNYTRYFTQSDVLDTISKSWNGKRSGDIEIVPEGEYKVMVSMTEGTNNPTTEFGQYSIFVNYSSAPSLDSNPSSTTTESITKTTNISSYISTHADSEDLSDYDEKSVFKITAGRERMALVGSPIQFNAKYTVSADIYCSPGIKWSFGDGFDAVGKDVEHIYKYPGEYQVVANGNCGESNSISRTVVKIITPNISVRNHQNGDVEIINNGNTEINIGNWKIKNNQKDFIFPQDTIISENNKITLAKEDINNSSSSEKILLLNSLDREVMYSQTETKKIAEVKSNETVVTEVTKLVNNKKETGVANQPALNQVENTPIMPKTINNNKDIKSNENMVQTATVMNSENSLPGKGFWANVINIPINGVKSFAHMFYDF